MAEAPLTGWKEIASFLGSSVRTVQRFERELGLPIHRTQASRGAVVRAYPSELSKWLNRGPVEDAADPELAANAAGTEASQPDGPRVGVGRRAVLIASVVLSLALVGWWAWHSVGRARGGVRGNSEAAAVRSLEGAQPTARRETRRVSLTIRPGLGSPLRIAGPDGGRVEMTLGRGLDLSLRPAVQGRELMLAVDRRLSPDGGLEPVGTLRLAAGTTERLEVNGVSLEITWNAAPPTVQH